MEGTNERQTMQTQPVAAQPMLTQPAAPQYIPAPDLSSQYGMQEQPDIVKTARKQFSKLGLMFFLGAVIILALGGIASFVLRMTKPEWLEDANISTVLSMVIMYLLGMPALILLVKRVPAVKVEQHHMKAGHFALAAIMGYAIAIVSNVVGIIITAIISLLKTAIFGGGGVNNEMVELITDVNIPIMFIFAVCLAPIYEEYVFRKLIVERTVRYGQATAALVSGLMFGLFHGNFNQFIYAFTLGVFLAFLYAKTGKLKVTIAIHMIFNFVGSVIVPGLMKLIDFDEYYKMYMEYQERRDMDLYMNSFMGYFGEHLIGWALYFTVLCCIFCVVLAGVILFIIFAAKRKFKFDRGEIMLPKGKRFSTVILNLGMILFILYWSARIVIQILM